MREARPQPTLYPPFPGDFNDRPILVGEANPYGNPRYALYPHPDGSAGHRLCHLVLQMDRMQYMRTFNRMNLCARRWSSGDAQAVARAFKRGPAALVLLGAKVARAFDVEFIPFAEGRFADEPGARWLVLPHPSGLNRLWNDPGMIDRARAALRAFAGIG